MKKTTNLRLLVAGIVVGLLVGCASGAKRADGSQSTVISQKTVVSTSNKITSTKISLSPKVAEKQSDLVDNGFSENELLGKVNDVLKAQSLLDSTSQKQNLALELILQKVRVRSTANAMLWGFMAGSDYITADVSVKDAKGVELDKFQVETSYALGGLVGGVASVRINWLYDSFASEIVKELTGQVNAADANK